MKSIIFIVVHLVLLATSYSRWNPNGNSNTRTNRKSRTQQKSAKWRGKVDEFEWIDRFPIDIKCDVNECLACGCCNGVSITNHTFDFTCACLRLFVNEINELWQLSVLKNNMECASDVHSVDTLTHFQMKLTKTNCNLNQMKQRKAIWIRRQLNLRQKSNDFLIKLCRRGEYFKMS